MSARTPESKRARVLELRAEGLTQTAISERLGLDQTTVSLIEREAGLQRRPYRKPAVKSGPRKR